MFFRPLALCTLFAPASFAQSPLPPPHAFGSDTNRRGVFTGAGITPLGLTCTSSGQETDCSGFLASDVDGTELDVTVRVPVGTPPYPLVAHLHGYGGSKTSQSGWDDQLVARGYAVLYLNPRGSSGYGQKFSDGTLNEWGGGDFKDLMAGVDEALKRYQWIDPDRLGVE